MKLSDVKGVRSFEVLPAVAEKIKQLTEDPDVVALFRERKVPKGMTLKEFGMCWCGKALDVVVTRHKNTFVAVQSAIDGITPDEYMENVTSKKMIDDVSGWYADDAFTALFFSLTQRTEKPSGSASESTKESKA